MAKSARIQFVFVRRPHRAFPLALPLLLLPLALVLLLLLLGVVVPAPAAVAAPTVQIAPLNPAFAEYQRDLWAGNASSFAHSGSHPTGLVPPTVLLPSFSGSVVAPLLATLPSAFDLRDSYRVTPVKNQNPHGTCWAFASIASLESAELGARYLWDFSEDNVVRTSGFDTDPYAGGGNEIMAAACMARGGLVVESDDPYGDAITPAGLAPRLRLKEMLIVCNDTAETKDVAGDLTAVKTGLATYGALYTSMVWSGAAYRSATSAYYGGTARYFTGSGHSVTIVGWDDNYSASNFAAPPPGNGAWIIKNSWGPAWGQQGYFYLSYHDYWAARRAVAFTGMGIGTYTSVYQYDPLGWVSYFNYGIGATAAWAANDFTATASERLTAVGFYTLEPGATYEVYTASTHAGSRTLRASGAATYPGYHVVPLTNPNPLDLTNGQTFSIIVKLVTTGQPASVAYEIALPQYSSQATSVARQSFACRDGSSWTDIGDPTGWGAFAGNTCIKAFAKPAAADTTAPVITASGLPSPDVWQTGAVTVGFSATDAGWGVLLTQAAVDDAPYRQCSSFQVQGDGKHTLNYCSIDKAGNWESTKSATINIDGTAPTTSVPSSTSNWRRSVTVSLLADDAVSGVAGTEYRLVGAPLWIPYGAPFPVATQGVTAWEYRSADAAGNVEAPRLLYVRIDSRAPTTRAYAASAKKGRAASLWYRVNDSSPGCGSAEVTLKIFKGKKLRKTLKPSRSCATNVKSKHRWRCSLRAGAYTMKVYATDKAGNAQRKVGSAKLIVN